ncbi:hypothetical protein ACROYT_G015143 [Oculina patagonica]
MEEAQMFEMDIQATVKKAHKAMKVHAQITVVKTRIIPCISGYAAEIRNHLLNMSNEKLKSAADRYNAKVPALLNSQLPDHALQLSDKTVKPRQSGSSGMLRTRKQASTRRVVPSSDSQITMATATANSPQDDGVKLPKRPEEAPPNPYKCTGKENTNTKKTKAYTLCKEGKEEKSGESFPESPLNLHLHFYNLNNIMSAPKKIKCLKYTRDEDNAILAFAQQHQHEKLRGNKSDDVETLVCPCGYLSFEPSIVNAFLIYLLPALDKLLFQVLTEIGIVQQQHKTLLMSGEKALVILPYNNYCRSVLFHFLFFVSAFHCAYYSHNLAVNACSLYFKPHSSSGLCLPDNFKADSIDLLFHTLEWKSRSLFFQSDDVVTLVCLCGYLSIEPSIVNAFLIYLLPLQESKSSKCLPIFAYQLYWNVFFSTAEFFLQGADHPSFYALLKTYPSYRDIKCKLQSFHLSREFTRTYNQYDFHEWSDDSNKDGEVHHIVGVHTWCPEINKPRAYVLGNSLTVSGSGKHQSDIGSCEGGWCSTNLCGLEKPKKLFREKMRRQTTSEETLRCLNWEVVEFQALLEQSNNWLQLLSDLLGQLNPNNPAKFEARKIMQEDVFSSGFTSFISGKCQLFIQTLCQ